MVDKPLVWLGSSRADLRKFPEETRQEAGFQLRRVQKNLPPMDWRPMQAVGPGVVEIRIHSGGEYRVFYVAKFAEAVYVLNAFEKHARKAPHREMEIARRRYRELTRIRSKNKEK